MCAPLPLLWSITLATLQIFPSPAAGTPGPMVCIQDQDTPNAMLKESPDALQGISFRSNIVQTGRQGDFIVSLDTVTSAVQSWRSKRSLAACLQAKNFTVPKRSRNNCCGVLKKKALDVKVKAIYPACMQHFFLQRLETQLMADKEMQATINELC